MHLHLPELSTPTQVDSSLEEVVLASMGSLQAHLDDCTLADFGQESHLGQHLHSLLVGLGSQLEALHRDPGALGKDPGVLGSHTGVWGSHSVLEVLK